MNNVLAADCAMPTLQPIHHTRYELNHAIDPVIRSSPSGTEVPRETPSQKLGIAQT
jgi:hypothetical protein